MITDIRLQQFRSYQDAAFEISPSVNIVVGPNASGKTSLLEAVLVLARGASYRAKDPELVRFGKTWARLDADTDAGKRTVKINLEPRLTKTYEFDGKPYQRLTAQHTLPVVLFEPDHLLLLSGAPELRRNYLDDLLEQLYPDHVSLRRNYRRLLAQRNALLKRARRPNNEELFPWNLRLSELGAVVARRRGDLTHELNERIDATYGELSKAKTRTSLSYHTQFPLESYESHLMEKLEADLAVDVLRGFTAAGPHREDLHVSFDDHPAEEAASRGEIRTFVLALKIIELELLTLAREQTPLLLLDDVFSELDGSRRQALTTHLQSYQTFITTTDADIVLKNFTKDSSIIPLGS